MPGPNLGSIEPDSTDHNSFNGINNVIYEATSQAFREYQKVLAKYDKLPKGNLSSHCKPAPHLLILTITTTNFCTS